MVCDCMMGDAAVWLAAAKYIHWNAGNIATTTVKKYLDELKETQRLRHWLKWVRMRYTYFLPP